MLGIGLNIGLRAKVPGAEIPRRTTNLIVDSDAINLWTAVGATVTSHVGKDPIGRPVSRMLETSNTSQHSFSAAAVNFTLGTAYTFSAKVAAETGIYVQLLLPGAAFGTNAWANFDLQNGVAGTVAASATAAIRQLSDGFYLISITATATATASGTPVIFMANSATMTRALGYLGSDTNTILISSTQVETGVRVTGHVSTAPAVTFTGNTADTIVGAIRWDAWFHPTVDTIRGAVETSLGPTRYHWRLPFFATEPTSSSASIGGAQTDMDTEIAYAAQVGLDYWAFFWYGVASANGMVEAWNLYQASPNKNDINWCLYFSGVSTLAAEVANNLANIVSYMGQSNYQKTADGRPLVFVYDDSAAKTTMASDLVALRNAATAAGLGDPYISFSQSTADATVINTYGFDATMTYTPVNSVTGAKTFDQLDTAARAKWDTQAAQGVDVVPCFSMGWDRRPRVDNPVPWETPSGSLGDYYYHVRMSDISTHIDACLAWVRNNPTAAPANVIIGYAWNENDEGGWISPTVGAKGGINRGHLDAVQAVLT